MVLLLGAVILLYWQNASVARTVGTLTLLAAVAWRLLPTMNKLVQQMLMMQQQIPQIEPVLRQLDEVAALAHTDTDTAHDCPLHEELRLENVSFRYPSVSADKPDALRNLNLHIPRGSMVGFVGPSGAGKSTIVGLLTGLFPPTGGNIFVDGRPMDNALREGWVRRIGYVPQSPFLLNSSIAENIAFSHWGAAIDRERCSSAAVWLLWTLWTDWSKILIPLSASGACAFPAGKCSVWPLPARSTIPRSSFCLTKPPAPLTVLRSRPSSRQSTVCGSI